MRKVLLLLMLPLMSMAQTDLAHTHWAVFFKARLSESAQQKVLSDCGLASDVKADLLKVRPVAFVPMNGIDAALLRQHADVTYVSPLYSSTDGKFVTYLSTFFVKLGNAQDMEVLQRLARELGIRVIGPDRYMSNVIKLETSKTGITAIEAIAAFRASGTFPLVSPNLMHTVADCSVDDPLFSRQWNLKNTGSPLQGNGTEGADMDVEAAWTITTGDPSIKIAILDSGVDTLHPDLVGKLLPGFDAMADPDSAGTDGYPTPTFDEDGHGTACAGIAAATGDNDIGVAGVCRDCSIIPIRVFSYIQFSGQVQPFSDTESFLRGINWQWQVANADVSSNSWGVPDFLLAFFPGGDSLVNLAIDAATSQGRNGKGLPMLFSSGNDGITDSIPIWPARYNKTVAINASSMCDERKSATSCDGEEWWAGNWGNHLDCAAPGVRIPTTDMTGSNGYNNSSYYNSFNGTSAACPNAAGVMGLLLSANPDLSRENAERHLINGCEKVGGYAYDQWKQHGHWSDEMGYGRINAHNALISAATVDVEENSMIRPIVRTLADRHLIQLNGATSTQWMLVDMSGRTVASGQVLDQLSIVHRGLSTGIYALRLSTGSGDTVVKLVVSQQ